MKTDAPDRDVIFASRNGVNREGLILVRGKHLVDDAGAGVIVAIEDDQDGILLTVDNRFINDACMY